MAKLQSSPVGANELRVLLMDGDGARTAALPAGGENDALKALVRSDSSIDYMEFSVDGKTYVAAFDAVANADMISKDKMLLVFPSGNNDGQMFAVGHALAVTKFDAACAYESLSDEDLNALAAFLDENEKALADALQKDIVFNLAP